MFGSNFTEKVQDALTKMGHLHIRALDAKVDGKTVTLTGEVPDVATKAKAMEIFNSLVETENTMNMLKVAVSKPEAAAAAAATTAATTAAMMGPPTAPPGATITRAEGPAPLSEPATRIHEVVKGETLSAIAKTYYGKASAYAKIFEANRDILKDPDHIYPGQKLKIP